MLWLKRTVYKPIITLQYEICFWGLPGGSVIKNLPANAEIAGDMSLIPRSARSPGVGNDNPLQYSSWEIPWTAEAGRLQSRGSQKVRQNQTYTHFHTYIHKQFPV